MWKRKLLAATCGLALSWCLACSPSWASSFGSACDEWRGDVETAVARWWPDLQVWKLWNAQLYAESRCDPGAVSPVGARGIAQIMPGTGRDLARRLGVDPFTSPHLAKFAIPAGAAYMAQLRAQWGRGRAPIDKHWLAAASYNRGTGNILKDQAECGDALLWPAVSVCTARHTPETPAYVSRIEQYWRLMEAR